MDRGKHVQKIVSADQIFLVDRRAGLRFEIVARLSNRRRECPGSAPGWDRSRTGFISRPCGKSQALDQDRDLAFRRGNRCGDPWIDRRACMYSPAKRYRQAESHKHSLCGPKRLHMILGLFFGVLACTWAFSGMLSMDPFPSRAP